MNGTITMRAIRELPRILIFGLLGFLAGFLMNGVGQSPYRDRPATVVCRDALFGNSGNVEDIAKDGSEIKVTRPAIDANGLRGPDPIVSDEVVVSAQGEDLEEQIRDTLLVDEASAAQQNEQPQGDDADNDPSERIRTMTAERQLEYVKGIAGNRDDASIVELKDLILFEDEGVRHAAIDTLIEILGQETGHYDTVEAILAENSMFMDDGQISKASEIALKVEEKRKHVAAEQD